MESNGRRKVLIAALFIGVALIVSGILLDMVVFPEAIKSRILESVQLRSGSDALKRYIRLPQPVHLKVYLYNVTNSLEVHAGVNTPLLQQLGPYVYDVHREKFEIEEDFGTDTLSYYHRTKYYFNRELSIGSEDDAVTVLNAPMLGIIEKTDKSSPTMMPFVNVALPSMFTEPETDSRGIPTSSEPRVFTAFMKTTVGRLLFHGVPIKCSRKNIFRGFVKSLVCSGLAVNLPPSIRRAEEGDGYEDGDFLFSFLHFKNNSREGPMTVRRGLRNPDSVGEIVTWKGQTEMKVWGPPPPESSPCNHVEGGDSSVFPPFTDENSVIKVFQPELCRSLTASFEKRMDFKGIPGMRFVADTNLFDKPDHHPDNWCFYPRGDEHSRQKYWSRTESGILDLSECSGSPMIVSFPHFYAASHNYLKYARGLHPEKKLHETYIDMETMTGTPLSAAKRLQFNMYLRRMRTVSYLKNVSEGLFPLMWAEEGMDLDDRFANLLSESLFDVIRLLDIIKWSVIALGVLEVIVVLIFARSHWRTQAGDAADQKMKEAYKLPTYEMTKTENNISTIVDRKG